MKCRWVLIGFGNERPASSWPHEDASSPPSATWERGPWSTNAAWNYVDGYEQTTRTGERVKPFATVHLNVGYKVGAATSVSLVLAKLFDRQPSWDSAFAFFDFTQADPRGRFASVKLNHRF